MLYELVVLLKDGEQYFFIDRTWSTAREDLITLAQERKSNNVDYVTIITDYKAISANII